VLLTDFGQPCINLLLAAQSYMLFGLAFAVIYWTASFFDFTPAAIYTLCAYLTHFLWTFWHLHPFVAWVITLPLCIGLACTLDWAVYRRLRTRKAGRLPLLLSSLGVVIMMQNLVAVVHGSTSITLRWFDSAEPIQVFGGRLYARQVWEVVITLAIMLAVHIIYAHTDAGIRLRAVAYDPDLARVVGINRDRTVVLALNLGTVLTGLAVLFDGMEHDFNQETGFNALLMAMIVTISAGRARVGGVIAGAFLLALVQQVAIWFLGTGWQVAVAYILLITILLLAPRGVATGISALIRVILRRLVATQAGGADA
jgi:branched-chain amino acid transport system permease protein